MGGVNTTDVTQRVLHVISLRGLSTGPVQRGESPPQYFFMYRTSRQFKPHLTEDPDRSAFAGGKQREGPTITERTAVRPLSHICAGNHK
jgi:hypothetical protein